MQDLWQEGSRKAESLCRVCIILLYKVQKMAEDKNEHGKTCVNRINPDMCDCGAWNYHRDENGPGIPPPKGVFGGIDEPIQAGKVFETDYAKAEQRVYSIYTLLAARMFGLRPDQVNQQQRNEAKVAMLKAGYSGNKYI
jgi:hypothetical protein